MLDYCSSAQEVLQKLSLIKNGRFYICPFCGDTTAEDPESKVRCDFCHHVMYAADLSDFLDANVKCIIKGGQYEGAVITVSKEPLLVIDTLEKSVKDASSSLALPEEIADEIDYIVDTYLYKLCYPRNWKIERRKV